jgi:hypothetical protein
MFKSPKLVTIFKPEGTAAFQVGSELMRDGKPTGIKITKITAKGPEVSVFLDSKEVINFYGLPYTTTLE